MGNRLDFYPRHVKTLGGDGEPGLMTISVA